MDTRRRTSLTTSSNDNSHADASELKVKAIGTLFATFGHAPSDEQFDGYMMALDDIPAPDVANAVKQLLRTKKGFLPRPAEIRDIALTNRHPTTSPSQVVSDIDRLCDEWGRQPREVPLPIDDPITAEVLLRSGGLPELTRTPRIEFSRFKAREIYKVAQEVIEQFKTGSLRKRTITYTLPPASDSDVAHLEVKELSPSASRRAVTFKPGLSQIGDITANLFAVSS